MNNEAESREVQDFAKSDGYSRKYNNFTLHKGWVCLNSEKDILCVCHSQAGNELDDYKEITLSELRDLVVLKRNDVGDATHESPCGELKFILLGDWWNLFTGGKWQQFSHKQSPRCNKLKPIEKPMKEYLRKNNDGEYILEVTDEREAQEPHAKHWIEVPKGCDYLISVFGVNSFIDSDMFAKFKTKNVLWSRKPMKEYLIKSGDGKYLLTHHDSIGAVEIPEGATYYAKDASLGKSGNFFFRLRSDDFDFEAVWLESNWIQAIFNVENQDVLWQRNNNQTIASAVESSHPEELPFIDDEPSINDQYAEIEKVRQDIINSPIHYADSTIECIDAMEAMMTPEQFIGYLRGNVFKYQWRYEKKNGIEDLKKAQWYLERLTEKVAEKNAPF